MIQLYDVLSGQIQRVDPARRGELRICACGRPADRPADIGDLRGYLLTDLIRRSAEQGGRLVTVCQNRYDVGPVSSEGDALLAGLATLNIRPAEYSPRASESIPVIIEMIARLIDTGHAHTAAGGCVYLGTGPLPDGEQPDGARVLWQGTGARHEPAWRAPWGDGFPSWHTACTAMSLRWLGHRADVHTGGAGLPPHHHDSERAQAGAIAGHDVTTCWVDSGGVLVQGEWAGGPADHGGPLAGLTARGLDPLALRLALLEHRYRQQVNLTMGAVEAAGKTLSRWRAQVAAWACEPSAPVVRTAVAAVGAAFDRDLDTPTALRTLRALAADPGTAPGAKFETFAHLDQLLGLDLVREVGRPADGSIS